MKLVKLISVFCALKCAYAANILGVFPLDWGSHYILGTKLMKGLAEAGHDITLISPYEYKSPPKNGSWIDVVLEGLGKEFKEMLKEVSFLDSGNKTVMENIALLTTLLMDISNQTFRHPNVEKLLKSNAKFDVVILDQLLNECHHAFAYHFNTPLIILNSIGPGNLINPKVGNSAPVSTVFSNNAMMNGLNEITFIKRLQSLAHNVVSYLAINYYLLPKHNSILQAYFPEAPDINYLYYNVSLVLLNSHNSVTDSVPLVPNMVEIGGYHIESPKKLPQDLQDFLDSAKDGVIYFSMGSSVKSKDLSEEKKTAILSVFQKLKQKILWKFEENLPGQSKNILIRKWMPQQDILAHPNIKLFITHGGLLSMTETVYHGVPVLTIPLFGDQVMNAGLAVDNGFGLKLSYSDPNFNEETLNNLIQELLNNPKYKENARTRSRIYHDRPLKPMESAVYWVEYIIRHKGAPHLRVAGVGMPWYKYFMVDVIITLIISIWIVVFSVKFAFRRLLSVFTKTTRSVKVKKN